MNNNSCDITVCDVMTRVRHPVSDSLNVQCMREYTVPVFNAKHSCVMHVHKFKSLCTVSIFTVDACVYCDIHSCMVHPRYISMTGTQYKSYITGIGTRCHTKLLQGLYIQ